MKCRRSFFPFAVACGALLGAAFSPAAVAAPEAPKFKPSKYSEAPVDITTNAYGAFKGAPEAPALGDTIPEFSLPRARGGTFKLSEELKKGPLLIMFYRGHW